MDIALSVTSQVVIMVIIAAAGVILKKTGKINSEFTGNMSSILLYLVNPMLIVNSFIREFEQSEFILWLISFAFGFGLQVVLVLLSRILFRNKTDEKNGINRYATVFSNAGFIGIPLVQAALGSDGVFLLVGYIVSSGCFMWTTGAKDASGGSYKISVKKALVNPSNIGAIAGFLVYVLQIPLGTILGGAVSSIAAINTAASMIIIGVLISEIQLKELLADLKVFKVIAARLVIAPLVVLLLCWAMTFTGIAGIEMAVMVNLIAASAPAAVATAMMAKLFGSEEGAVYGGKVVAMTTLFSVITIPSILFLASFIIHV